MFLQLLMPILFFFLVSIQHFKLLLASTDPEILIASLETLSSLVKISSKLHLSGKLVELGSINSCLLSLAQGWGSKEEGLGLYACVMLNETTQEGGLNFFFRIYKMKLTDHSTG